MIDGSRRARISKGSGTQVSDVNQLVDRFFEARKMMMSMARGGGMPGMPGMPGVPGLPGVGGGAKRSKAKQAPKKGKARRVSGNPAKRAQQEKAAGQKVQGGNGANPPADANAEDFELPAEFSKFLPKQ